MKPLMELEQYLIRLQRVYNSSILLRASLWYTGGRLLLRGTSFVAVFIFTRLLTPDEYGTVAIFLTWTSLFSTILTLNLNSGVARGYFDFQGSEFDAFASSVLWLSIFIFVMSLGILVSIPRELSERFFSLNTELLLLSAFISFFMMLVKFKQRIWQVQNNYGRFIRLEFLIESGVILLSVVLIMLPIWRNVPSGAALGRLLAFTIVYTPIGLTLIWRQLRANRFRLNTVYWRYALVYAVPMIPHVISNVVLTQFDRVIIDAYIGRSEAGVYTFAYQLGAITSIIWLAINTAWVPWFYRRMEIGDAANIHLRSRQYLWAFTFMTIGLMFIVKPIALFLAPTQYQEATYIIPIIVAGGYFQMLYSFAVTAEMYYKRTAYVSLGTILAGTLNVILNLMFIPRYGIVIAAWTTLLSYAVLFVIHSAIVQFKFDVRNLFPQLEMYLLGLAIVAFAVLWRF